MYKWDQNLVYYWDPKYAKGLLNFSQGRSEVEVHTIYEFVSEQSVKLQWVLMIHKLKGWRWKKGR